MCSDSVSRGSSKNLSIASFATSSLVPSIFFTYSSCTDLREWPAWAARAVHKRIIRFFLASSSVRQCLESVHPPEIDEQLLVLDVATVNMWVCDIGPPRRQWLPVFHSNNRLAWYLDGFDGLQRRKVHQPVEVIVDESGIISDRRCPPAASLSTPNDSTFGNRVIIRAKIHHPLDEEGLIDLTIYIARGLKAPNQASRISFER